MEKRLHNAAIEGDVVALRSLLQQDRLIFDRFMASSSFTETPLHVSAMLGHSQFTKEILRLKPQLAEELNSHRSTPLHLASSRGFEEIVKDLVSVRPEMCLILDLDGLTPLHIATMKGHVSVMRALLRTKPESAKIMVDNRSTILHLCARHNQLEALKVLVESIGNDDEFLNSKDEYGNTVLHLAVSNKRVEIITYLVKSTAVRVNELNLNGFTEMDLLAQSSQDVKEIHILEALRSAGAKKATKLPPSLSPAIRGLSNNHQTTTNSSRRRPIPQKADREIISEEYLHREMSMMWTRKTLDTLMLAATIIATMAFQVGVNPPGGVWQETKLDPNDNKTMSIAGMPVMKDSLPVKYKILITSNTVGFVGSLSLILLLISGLPIRRKLFVWVLMVIMWITVSAMAITYGIVIVASEMFYINAGLGIIVGWVLLVVFILLVHFIRLIVRVLRRFFRSICSCFRRRRSHLADLNQL